ncbi:MAG TPA: hypothetical protein VMS17_20250 [Gemmataceae bacterium]|nr:hypothetical protein [Gemmataceae bacterium]
MNLSDHFTLGKRPVHAVLAAARRRYHAAAHTERPPLDQLQNCIGLFTAPELVLLAKGGCWPLPEKAMALIATAPAERRRRRLLVRRLARAELRRILRAELPEAVAVLVGRILADRKVAAGRDRR